MKSLLAAGLISIAAIAAAAPSKDVCTTLPGFLSCSQGSISELPFGFFGKTILNGTNVTNSTHLTTGYFGAKNSKLNDLDITAGKVDLTATQITGNTPKIATGFLTLSHSEFESVANLYSPDIDLKNSTTAALNVSSNQPTKRLIVKLEAGTSVAGDITFNNGHGEVCLDGGTVNGKVKGGITRKGNCPFDNKD